MYDLYPDMRPTEWGPAHLDPEHPLGNRAVQLAMDLRDGTVTDEQRPDDN
ncbi:MAG: hypothetical protein V9F00_03485 [Nocardioides sp.]|jgi:hypothetical protein